MVKELEVEGKAKFKGATEFGTPESPQGITIYDEDTNQPVCVKSKSLNLTATVGVCGILSILPTEPIGSDEGTEIASSTNP